MVLGNMFGGSEDDVALIAATLLKQFGEDAKIVARIQVEEAKDEDREMWEAVLFKLSG